MTHITRSEAVMAVRDAISQRLDAYKHWQQTWKDVETARIAAEETCKRVEEMWRK